LDAIHRAAARRCRRGHALGAARSGSHGARRYRLRLSLHENDDPTAEYQCRAFHALGIAASDFTPWNAYPWYINRKPSPAELDAGVEPLVRLITLLPHLQVVLLQGLDAQSSWRRLTRRHPEFLQARQLTVIPTIHPSPQALRSPDPAIRQARMHHRMNAYQKAADVLHGNATT
jgi:hypothetical protein